MKNEKSKNEIKKHYLSIDFSIWEKELNFCADKIRKLKTDRAKKIWQLKIYSLYIQIIEVFSINVFAIMENNLANLFLSNEDLRKKMRSQFHRKIGFINFIVGKWLFYTSAIVNIEKKQNDYKHIIEESIEDYLKDFGLLNAYKHGFRTHSRGKNEISISKTGANERYLVGKFDSKIVFLSKEKNKIYKNAISFNCSRVVRNTYFLLNIVENIHEILLHSKCTKTLFLLPDCNYDGGRLREKSLIGAISRTKQSTTKINN